MAKSKATTSAVKPVSNDGVDAENISKQRELISQKSNAIIFENVALQMFSLAISRCKPSKITSRRVSSNTVYYYAVEVPTGNAPIPGTPKNPPTAAFKAFPSTNLDKWHWVTGISGLSGLFDGDMTRAATVSGGVREISFKQTRANVSLAACSGVIWSVDSTKSTARPDTTTTDWNNLLKQTRADYRSSILTYNQMPNARGDVTVNGASAQVTAPTTLNFRNFDDVQWAHLLYSYWQACIDYRKKVETSLKLVTETIATQRADWGKLHPSVVNNTLPGGKHGGNSSGGLKNPNPLDGRGTHTAADETKPIIYNLPGVKSGYFKPNDFANEFIVVGNAPSRVASANELWGGPSYIEAAEILYKGAHKGMIQSYILPGQNKGKTKYFDPNQGKNAGLKSINKRRYGFQFMYNPSTISMHYAGAPQVDIGLEISGADKVALIGSGVTSSTVSFQLLINRMGDMRVINRLIQSLSDNTKNKQTLTNDDDWKEVYSTAANHPTKQVDPDVTDLLTEFKGIREKGTMYDIEYLLRTLIGYELPSQLRGNALTSDIGYLGAYPVELHIGKNMRYLVTVDSFDITHTIFTQDMVPVFTNMSITCNRLPEFNKNLSEIELKTTTKDASN